MRFVLNGLLFISVVIVCISVYLVNNSKLGEPWSLWDWLVWGSSIYMLVFYFAKLVSTLSKRKQVEPDSSSELDD